MRVGAGRCSPAETVCQPASFLNACSELDVRTEAELDAKLQEMHYRIEHESIPLNEEKRLLQQIKKLESQRAKVGSCGGWWQYLSGLS